jgi:hypothetical protein
MPSGAAMRLVDGKEFPTIGRGLWWAAETVTTVGYGDVVARATPGRVLGTAPCRDTPSTAQGLTTQ